MQLSEYLFNLRKNDWTLIIVILLLMFFGLASIYSVALGQGTGEFLNFQKQIIFIVVGLIFLVVSSNINYNFWRKIGWLGYAVGVFLLALVLTPLGSDIRGSQGWFDLGFFSFQPVELVKIFLIILLADLYSRYSRSMHKISHLMLTGLLAFIPFSLVMLQPDFGSAMVLFFSWFFSFILITKNKWHIFFVISTVVLIFFVAWFFVFQNYQKDRILTFLDPSLDPLGRGYNVQQSIIAVGAGGVIGRGLGFGSQSQLKFIPESQTDFIFSVIAEEFGLIGVVLILVFFGIIFYRLYKTTIKAPDDFGMFLSILIMILIFVHVFINIGMGIGLMPVTGISLPFISYGGSFLLTILFLISIILNIYKVSLIYHRD